MRANPGAGRVGEDEGGVVVPGRAAVELGGAVEERCPRQPESTCVGEGGFPFFEHIPPYTRKQEKKGKKGAPCAPVYRARHASSPFVGTAKHTPPPLLNTGPRQTRSTDVLHVEGRTVPQWWRAAPTAHPHSHDTRRAPTPPPAFSHSQSDLEDMGQGNRRISRIVPAHAPTQVATQRDRAHAPDGARIRKTQHEAVPPRPGGRGPGRGCHPGVGGAHAHGHQPARRKR